MRSRCSTPRGGCLSSKRACLGGEEDQVGMLKQGCRTSLLLLPQGRWYFCFLREGGTMAGTASLC